MLLIPLGGFGWLLLLSPISIPDAISGLFFTSMVSSFVAEVFTGTPGVFVNLEDTIKGFKAICAGEYDHLPEGAFYMVGTIEEAIEKAQKMAAAAA